MGSVHGVSRKSTSYPCGQCQSQACTVCWPAIAEVLDPPRPEQRPHKVEPPPNVNAAPRDDPYYWLRDDERKDPTIIEHLKVRDRSRHACLLDGLLRRQQIKALALYR